MRIVLVVGVICGAPSRALLPGREVFVEIVELAAGEHVAVDPLAVCFLLGPLNTLAGSRWPVADGGRGRDASMYI